jgi:hypothetical protein
MIISKIRKNAYPFTHGGLRCYAVFLVLWGCKWHLGVFVCVAHLCVRLLSWVHSAQGASSLFGGTCSGGVGGFPFQCCSSSER